MIEIEKSQPVITGTVNETRQTRHGYMCFNPRDVYVGRCLATYGEYSESEVSILLQACRPGALVLDIGANIGCHTLPMARAVGENGVVIAFEPQRHAFQALCANAALNSLMNVIARNEAVGAAAGVTTVPIMNFNNEQNFAGLQLGDWPQGDEIRVITIDDMDLVACHLMKIDVEGWESAVLEGATKTLQKFKPPIYIENNQQGLQAKLIRQLEAMGYECWWHNPTLFSAENFYGKKDDIFAGAISQNMFCLHRDVKAEMRGFGKASADPTGDICYVTLEDGRKMIVQASAGKCKVKLPDGNTIELGGPNAKATLLPGEQLNAKDIAARIKERRRR